MRVPLFKEKVCRPGRFTGAFFSLAGFVPCKGTEAVALLFSTDYNGGVVRELERRVPSAAVIL